MFGVFFNICSKRIHRPLFENFLASLELFDVRAIMNIYSGRAKNCAQELQVFISPGKKLFLPTGLGTVYALKQEITHR